MEPANARADPASLLEILAVRIPNLSAEIGSANANCELMLSDAVVILQLSTASGPVAQLGARFHGMEEVVGSNPTRSTKSEQIL